MRRIPRPSRAIDTLHAYSQSSSLSSIRSPPQCSHLRSTSAAFSTSTSRCFLLSGKQDKRKHQQFVRRWQKRLLGDSEPIGAHVDPYDPTSPVRIAPAEQGEYEEVLIDDRTRATSPAKTSTERIKTEVFKPYQPAVTGSGLLRVGGDEWVQRKREQELAKEFEKLTLRTYTPLSLDMANTIEDLTGTPYTLRDENLLMAQTTHEVTARPYTTYNFGMHKKPNLSKELRSRFEQAVVEVYTLKQAGLDMDLSKFSNRGIYSPPAWIQRVKLGKAPDGEPTLLFPWFKNASQLLEAMQTAPEWESMLEEEEAALAGDELVVEEGVDTLEPLLEQEAQPTMDSNTPAFKKAALVKVDPEKQFDFMSNRPVPRAQPVVESESATVSKDELEPVQSATLSLAAQLAELSSAANDSHSIIGGLRRSFIEYKAQALANNIKALTFKVSRHKSSSSTENLIKWSEVQLDDSTKFALFKRLLQLTERRIPDVQLTAVKNLSDLYGSLCTAVKPQSRSLYTTLFEEGRIARQRLKKEGATHKRKADLGDLITLGNVELRRTKPTKTEKRTQTGLEKVITYALMERGLGKGKPKKTSHPRRKRRVVEGTREVPEFGKVVSEELAINLAKRYRRMARSAERWRQKV